MPVRSAALAELLEQRTLLAAVSDGGGSTLTISLAANEDLAVISNGTTYTFSIDTSFTNGGVVSTGDFSAFGSTSLTLNASGLTPYSTIAIVDSGTGSTVTFNNSGANAYSDIFNVTLDNSPGAISFNGTSDFGSSAFSVTTSNLTQLNASSTVKGTGGLTIRSDDIAINSTANLDGGTSTVTLRPNSESREIDLGTEASGKLSLTDAELDRITAGKLLIRTGGAGGGNITVSADINLSNNATPIPILRLDTSNGLGDVTATSGGIVVGQLAIDANGTVNVTDSTTSVTTLAIETASDPITFTNASDLSIGTVDGVVGVLSSFFTRTITLNVTGSLTQTSRIATSTTGSLLVTATGSATLTNTSNAVATLAANVGGAFSYTDSNDLTVGTVNSTSGVTAGGAVAIRSVGSNNKLTISSGQTVQTTSGGVALQADKMDLAGNVTATGQVVALIGNQASIAINVGSAVDTTSGTLELSDAELDRVTSGTTQIGDSTSGTLTVSAAITHGNGLSLTTGTGVTINQDVTMAADKSLSITTATFNTAASADLITSGTGTVSITADDVAIDTTSTLQSASTVTFVTQTAARPINVGTQTTGSLSLTDAELDRVTASTLRVGDSSSGAITISSDISPANVTTLHLTSGSTVTGTAGGVVVNSLAIRAAGAASVTHAMTDVTNVAISAPGFSVDFNDANGLTVTSVDGVDGISANDLDVNVSGNLTIANTPAANDITTTQSLNLNVTANDAVLTTAAGAHLRVTSSSDLKLVADEMDLAATMSASQVRLENFNAGELIILGTNPGQAGTLELSDAELDLVGGTVRVGRNDANASGNITVTAPISLGTLIVRTGAGIVDGNASGTDITATNLTLRTASGVGNSGADQTLEINATNLSFFNGSGGSILLNEANGLSLANIDGFNPSSASDVNLSSTNGNITVTNSTSVTGNASLTLNAIANNVTVSNAVSSASGNVTLQAGADVVSSGASGSVTTTSGNLFFTGDNDSSGSGTITFDRPINLGSGTATFSLSSTNGTVSDVISGTGNVVKSGSGTLTLTDPNNYSGTTTVNDGRLNLTGSITSNTTVANGGTLGGTGTINSANTLTVQSGGHVAPGTSPGILNSGSVTFASGSAFDVEIGGTTPGSATNNHDQLVVTGTVNLGGATLTTTAFNGFVPAGGNTFAILLNDGTDAITGTFAGLAEGATISNFLGSGLSATISYVANADGGASGNDVVLTIVNPGTLSAVLSSGSLTITDSDGTKNNSLTVSVSGSDLVITDTNEAFDVAPAGGTLSNGNKTLTIPAASVTGTLTINSVGGTDTINVSTLGATLLSALMINAGAGTDTVNLNGDVTFASNKSLSVTAETLNTAASADVVTSGTGTISITADDVAINSTSTLQSATTVSFVTQTAARAINVGTETAGSLSLTDAELDRITSGTTQIGDVNSGTITVSAAITHGNHLSLTTGAGVAVSQAVTMSANKNLTITSQGTSAGISVSSGNADLTTTGTGNINLAATRDIIVSGTGLVIQSENGNVTLLANSSGTTGGDFDGILINAATVTTTGSGSVSLTGTGGGGSGVNNVGVQIEANATISSGGAGTVTVLGTGGSGGGVGNRGVTVSGTTTNVTSGGGHVNVTGIGGSGSGNSNDGVSVFSGGSITSGGAMGNVTVQGTSGSGSGALSSGISVGGGQITSGGGNVQVTGMGSSNAAGGVSDGVSINNLGQISAGGSGTVNVQGTGGSSPSNFNEGVFIQTGSTVTSSGGGVTVIGVGGGSGASVSNPGIENNGTITSGAGGNVSLTGTSPHSGNGLIIYGTVTSGTAGTVSLNGTGNNSTTIGVRVDGTVTSGGGNVTITSSTGVEGANGGDFTTAANGGNITVITNNLNVPSGSTIDAGANVVNLKPFTNNFTISLGGPDTVSQLGLSDADLDNVTAGTINIGDSNSGPITFSGNITRPANSVLNLTTGANNNIAFGAFSLNAGSGGTVTFTTSGTGAITTGDNTGTDLTAGTVTLNAGSNGIATSSNFLRLAATTVTAATSGNGEINLVEADSVTIGTGDLNAGSGTTRLGGGTFLTGSGRDILGPVTVANGATLGGTGTTGTITTQSGGRVAPGTSPGILSSTGISFSSGSFFDVEIGGTTPGNATNNHDQLLVTGTVSLGNATLSTTAFNGFVPVVGNTFAILLNDDSDAITGTFNGLVEGSSITNFLGSGLNAVISYVANADGGASGNDVVLTVVNPGTLSAVLSSGSLTITDADGTKDNSLTVSVSGSDLVITDTNEAFDVAPAGGTLSNGNKTLTIPAASVTGTLTINSVGGTDTIDISALGTTLLSSLTIDAGAGTDTVNLNGDVTFASNKSLSVTAETLNTAASADVIASGTGTILVTADDVAIDTTSTLQSASTVTFVTQTVAREINVGTQTTGALSLTDAELDRVTSGTTQIGDTNSGTLTVSAAITHANDLSLTTGAGVTVNRAITMSVDKDLSINSTSTTSRISLLNATSDITTTGSGAVSIVTTRNIFLNIGSSLTTVNGGITLSANSAGTQFADFVGIETSNVLIQTTGTGDIQLLGKGAETGNDSSGMFGVILDNGTSITSTASGPSAGKITITGTGGNGTSNNHGVLIGGATTDVTSVDGNISITGTGGDGSADANIGIWLVGIETVSSTGVGPNAASITITGFGGAGTFNNYGVYLQSDTTDVTSTDGDITITGTGGVTEQASETSVFLPLALKPFRRQELALVPHQSR